MFSSAQTNGLPPTVTIGVGTACGIVIVILVVVIVYLSRRRRHSPGQLFRLLLRFCLFAFGNIIIPTTKNEQTTIKTPHLKGRRQKEGEEQVEQVTATKATAATRNFTICFELQLFLWIPVSIHCCFYRRQPRIP